MFAVMARITLPKRVLTTGVLALGMFIGHAATALAQNSGESQPKLLLIGVHYGAPERVSGSVSGLFLFGRPTRDAGSVTTKALEIRASVGLGGYGVGIGPRLLNYGPFGPEAMLTVRRTFSSPRRATGHSTYVGLEVGYQLLGRVSIGVARQVDGPAGRRDTMLIWSVGLQIPYGIWRW